MAPAEEGSSDGEAVSGVDGKFSSGETGTTFMERCSGEVWKYGQDQGKRGSRNGHVGIMCVQMMVEVKGVDEIMKENHVEETKGERRESQKVEDNSNLCGEVIVEKLCLFFIS